jgi:hypothetical protein
MMLMVIMKIFTITNTESEDERKLGRPQAKRKNIKT